MRWQEPLRQLDVTVELRDVEVGAAIEGERFSVPCPAGMTVIELACEASPVALR
jgi:outer membrane lipoprotein-sorting protein